MTSVGRLIPQPAVKTRAGERRLDDVLGDGFALLGFLDDISLFERSIPHASFRAISARRVLVSETLFQSQYAGSVEVITDPTLSLIRGLDCAKGRIFVVRPDRYVLGAFAPAGADKFAERLTALIRAIAAAESSGRKPDTASHTF